MGQGGFHLEPWGILQRASQRSQAWGILQPEPLEAWIILQQAPASAHLCIFAVVVVQQSGPFKKAAPDELSKRRIVKARRSGTGERHKRAEIKQSVSPRSRAVGCSSSGTRGSAMLQAYDCQP